MLTTFFAISYVINPGRKTRGGSTVTSIIVDSNPIPTMPPSIIMSMRPSKSSITCSPSVGLGLPDKLALGAAMLVPASLINLLAIG